MADALIKRQLNEAVATLKEVAPISQRSRIRDAEKHLFNKEWGKARECIGKVEEAMLQAQAQAEVDAGARDSAALALARGVETAPADRAATTRDGLRWMLKKLSASQAQAGERYQALYGRARADGVKSCLNDDYGGDGGSGPAMAHIRAREQMQGVVRHVLSATGPEKGGYLVSLLDSVCGEGVTVREIGNNDDRRVLVLEADLKTALDMVAVHLGLIRVAA
jgi:hypothetical protein